jgi:hypothetical protein
MVEKNEKKSKISRRDFLKDAGICAAIGGAALVAGCAGKTTTETVTVTSPPVTKVNETTKTVSVTGSSTTQTVTVTGPTSTVKTTTTATVTSPPVTATVAPTSFTILNPEGQMEPIPLKPLAKRISGGLAGKTIYVVSVNFTATDQFLVALTKIFKEKFPTSNPVFKVKAGSYAASDPDLWAEVKAKAAGFVMAVGH